MPGLGWALNAWCSSARACTTSAMSFRSPGRPATRISDVCSGPDRLSVTRSHLIQLDDAPLADGLVDGSDDPNGVPAVRDRDGRLGPMQDRAREEVHHLPIEANAFHVILLAA